MMHFLLNFGTINPNNNLNLRKIHTIYCPLKMIPIVRVEILQIRYWTIHHY